MLGYPILDPSGSFQKGPTQSTSLALQGKQGRHYQGMCGIIKVSRDGGVL